MESLFPVPHALQPAYKAVDWASTPLGPVGEWSTTLRAALDLALNTRFPVTLMWGPQLVMLYNEAYIAMIGDKHPAALGSPASEVFPEVWDVIGPMLDGVMSGQGATWAEDSRLELERAGFAEETFFTFSYSPVRAPDGSVQGVIDIAAETTERVVNERRLVFLSRLGLRLIDLADVPAVADAALELLRADLADLRGAALIGADVGSSQVEPWLAGAGARPATPLDVTLAATESGRVATIRLDRVHGAESHLVVLLNPHVPQDHGMVSFLRLIAFAIAQAMDAVGAREVERQKATAERALSESLQRSLLTRPLETPGLQVAVRYQPAAQLAQVGGDWYDSFQLPDGSLTLVIGDVSGHDRQAAASMAQVRNLLRGVSYTVQRPPSRVLSGLDDAMRGLEVNAIASAVLARVESPGPDAPGGESTMQWSSAGHLPPVLIGPDGSAVLLESAPDLLLGVQPGLARGDHAVTLPPGSTVVLYTDGLIERRGEDIDRGLARLVEALGGAHALEPEQVCDHLLGAFGDSLLDDIAILVLRTSR